MSQPPEQAPSKATRSRRMSRARAEEAILDAFERVVARDGFSGLGPTAVMAEAGLGKPLLYRYFGDLSGLIEAWGNRRGMWPAPETLAGPEPGETEPMMQIKASLAAIAAQLRGNSFRLEVLAEELTPATSISPILRKIRNSGADDHEAAFPPDHPQRQRRNFRLNVVLCAALVYCALRSRTSPDLQGIRLDTEEGWKDMLQMMFEIIDDAMIAAQFRQLMSMAGSQSGSPFGSSAGKPESGAPPRTSRKRTNPRL